MKGDYIDREANEGRMGVMPLAIVTETANGRTYSDFSEAHRQIALEEASQYLEGIGTTYLINPHGAHSQVTHKGVYTDLRRLQIILRIGNSSPYPLLAIF